MRNEIKEKNVFSSFCVLLLVCSLTIVCSYKCVLLWRAGPGGVYQGDHRDQDRRQARQVRSGAFLCVPMYFYVFLCMHMIMMIMHVPMCSYVFLCMRMKL
jgi:hypothetical protein